MKRILLSILLTAAILVLVYLVFESIMSPVRFNREQNIRKTQVVEHMKNIRAAQLTYRSLHNSYTGSFDTLLLFLKTDKIPVVKMVPDLTDTTFTRTINDTIAWVLVADSLLKNTTYPVDSFAIIPFSGGQKFELQAGKIDRGGVLVNVFEAKAHFKTYLAGMDDQLLRNLIAGEEQINKFPGLKVGSMNEPSTDGNWE
ncbi:MAG: hypothetical protein U1C46_08590 [Bacteroidales bacterium]|nr:hypothetical protein [Bacteroidales bacterium]